MNGRTDWENGVGQKSKTAGNGALVLSVRDAAAKAKDEDAKLRAARNTAPDTSINAVTKDGFSAAVASGAWATGDSFTNFAQKMGIGADNPLTTAGYGFNPITRIRNLLEWIHRGSWLGGVAVDVVADDMTRMGATMSGELKPDQASRIEERVTQLGLWSAVNDTVKWARLYGGCIAVMLIEGQKTETPLRIETVGKGQFQGLLVLDRWMVEPSLEDLVQEPGPDLGLPKYYRITADAPALPRLKVHHSRCMRLEGIRLPYWQRIQENMWGLSILERLYDRMIAFDSATTGAAQLVYKSYLRTYKVKDMREIVAAGGPALDGLVKYVDMMRRFQNVEGVTLLDGEDEFETASPPGFAGLSDALTQFAGQIAGALQIPLVRLFGQSPAGFSTGETDLRNYYDTIRQQQERHLRVPLTRMYRMVAQSEGIALPEGFRLEFPGLWQLTETEKAAIATQVADSVVKANEAAILSPRTALQELRQSSRVTGVFSNITDEEIESASDEPAPPPDSGGEGEGDFGDEPASAAAKKGGTQDAGARSVSVLKRAHDLDAVIESPKGTLRQGTENGKAWEAELPADYGYLRAPGGRVGADGEGVDCYVGDRPELPHAFVVDQNDRLTGRFDEHKVLLGFKSLADAQDCYARGFSDGKGMERIGAIRKVSIADLRAWLANGVLEQPYRSAS